MRVLMKIVRMSESFGFALLLLCGASQLHADTIVEYAASGSLDSFGGSPECLETGGIDSCTLSGTVTFDQSLNQVVSADLVVDIDGTSYDFNTWDPPVVADIATVINFSDSAADGLSLWIDTPTIGDLSGYDGGILFPYEGDGFGTAVSIDGVGFILGPPGSLTPVPEPRLVSLAMIALLVLVGSVWGRRRLRHNL